MFNLKKLLPTRGSEVAASATPLTSIPRPLSSTHRTKPKPPVIDPALPTDTREAGRFVPRRASTILLSESGKKIPARIINVSALGIAVEADFSQVPAGTIVMVGERKVRSGRKIARGTVFLFERPLSPSLCNPDLVI